MKALGKENKLSQKPHPRTKHHVSMLYTVGVMLVHVFENNGGRPPSSSRSSKVIDLGGANRKPICNFLLVISSNFRHISCRFRDIDA